MPDDPVALNAKLAEVFLRAAGIATRRAFAGWAGLSQKDAQQALEQLEPVAAALDGAREPYYVLKERDHWLEKAPEQSASALIPFEDNLIACQGGFKVLIDASYHAIEVTAWGSSKKRKIGDTKHADLRSVVAANGIRGFWEYHPHEARILYHCFSPLSTDDREKVERAAENTARFLTEEVGHGRSFSLDTDQALLERVEIISSL